MTSYSDPPRPDVDEAVAALTELDTFAGSSKAELRTIAAAGVIVTVPKGWSLMWEKTPADKAYVVLSGTASARIGDTEVGTIEPGELVGEMAIVNRRLRSATVVAATDLSVLHFTREAIERLAREIPAFAGALANAAAKRA